MDLCNHLTFRLQRRLNSRRTRALNWSDQIALTSVLVSIIGHLKILADVRVVFAVLLHLDIWVILRIWCASLDSVVIVNRLLGMRLHFPLVIHVELFHRLFVFDVYIWGFFVEERAIYSIAIHLRDLPRMFNLNICFRQVTRFLAWGDFLDGSIQGDASPKIFIRHTLLWNLIVVILKRKICGELVFVTVVCEVMLGFRIL